MDVTYFRPRRLGPESVIENTIADSIPRLFPNDDCILWAAGSMPVGAGMPDLIAVQCIPQVLALKQTEVRTMHILGYLRRVGRVRFETIIGRMGMSPGITSRLLANLVDIKAVVSEQNAYFLSPIWRDVLPEIITIEVKMQDWRRAIQQAARNTIFAHRSFIALPECLAYRIRREPILQKLGIGLLSVDNRQTVKVLRRTRRQAPRIWMYYYRIAAMAAKHL